MIDEIAGENVVIKGEEDFMVTLPVKLLAAHPEGGIMALANYSDIIAALEAVGG